MPLIQKHFQLVTRLEVTFRVVTAIQNVGSSQ